MLWPFCSFNGIISISYADASASKLNVSHNRLDHKTCLNIAQSHALVYLYEPLYHMHSESSGEYQYEYAANK